MQYTDYSVIKVAMFKFIAGWYNRNRIHSSFGFHTNPQNDKMISCDWAK